MQKKSKDTKGITVSRNEDVATWYEEVCLKSELADFGPVKGTIVMRPRGYYIWEQIQRYFAESILKKQGVPNASFPLFIPERFFKLEAEHAKGFAPELAWIATACDDPDLKKDKAIIRPTSEMVILDSFKKWLRNYRQLPLKVNQWANIVRWEVKQTKLFLRGREFLWQEGHCLYQTQVECEQEVDQIIHWYAKLCEEILALPTIVGEKTPLERFPGADKTLTIESLMPDGKAVQMGTSHKLNEGFCKGFDITYTGEDEKEHTPFYSSWGVSTRLIGAAIMMHSDDKGLVLAPNVAMRKVVIIPMVRKDNRAEVLEYASELAKSLTKYDAHIDDRDYSLGWRLSDHELKGTPLVLIVGGAELEKNEVTLKVRDLTEKKVVEKKDIFATVKDELALMHKRLFEKASQAQSERIKQVKTVEEFSEQVKDKMALVPFCGCNSCEKKVEETYPGVGTRCIDLKKRTESNCLFCDKPACGLVYFSRSY